MLKILSNSRTDSHLEKECFSHSGIDARVNLSTSAMSEVSNGVISVIVALAHATTAFSANLTGNYG